MVTFSAMRILSGIQPSGALHLGNYFGMMRPSIELQEKGFNMRSMGRSYGEDEEFFLSAAAAGAVAADMLKVVG